MALLKVLTTDGREIVVHSSIFDALKTVEVAAMPSPSGRWEDVWARVDEIDGLASGAHPPGVTAPGEPPCA